jgi:deazaflavin-dependent oxidoreductase (nitroreductase family)
VFGDVPFKLMNGAHRFLLTMSGGRLGWQAFGMPVLELTTVGRKTGRPHTVLLTSPVQEQSTLVVVASRGGTDSSPAWLLNLQANPQVEVALQGGSRMPMRARIATAEERSRLWPLVVARYRNYGTYQTRTQRQIPLVVLDPAD